MARNVPVVAVVVLASIYGAYNTNYYFNSWFYQLSWRNVVVCGLYIEQRSYAIGGNISNVKNKQQIS